MPNANRGPGEEIGTSGGSKCPPIICEGDRGTHALREDKGGKIVISSSEKEATITQYQEQLKRTRLPITEFLPVEMPCGQLPMVWLRKVRAQTQGKDVGLPFMRELHGERAKIPLSKVTNLMGKKPRALIECARFGVKRGVR